MPKKRDRYYSERASPFFRLKSRAKLADLLFISRTKLRTLACAEDLYVHFRKPKRSGGSREICAPREDLKAVQSRIATLLQRIVPPDYLFAPVAGRSYVDNAARHLGARSIRSLDIVDFFPSCTGKKVYRFFHERMECSPDVAAVIKAIVTHEDSLPQGSPCSPILAYLCYADMWEEIARIVEGGGCIHSVYADDVTISGETVPERAVWEIKKILRKHGHRHNAGKERSKRDRPAEVTGVIVSPRGLHAPNRLHKKCRDIRRELRRTSSDTHRADLTARVRGREAQMNQVKAGMKGRDPGRDASSDPGVIASAARASMCAAEAYGVGLRVPMAEEERRPRDRPKTRRGENDGARTRPR